MTITTLGFIFGAWSLVCLFGKRSWTLWLLSAAMPFSQSAALIVSGNTVQPFYLAAVVAVAFLLRDSIRASTSRRSPRVETLIWCVAAFFSLTALVLPFLFQGARVLVPRGGVDAQVANPGYLSFSISNLAQLGYVVLASAVVVFFLRHATARQYLGLGFSVGTVLNFWSFVAWRTGLPFPSTLFDTDPDTAYVANYDGGARIRGIFAEPSLLATFSLAAIAFFVFLALRARGAVLVGAIVAVVANALIIAASFSGTAVVGVGASAACVLLFYGYRFVTGRIRVRPAMAVASIGVFVAAVLAAPSVSAYANSLIGGKLDSSSYSSRTAADVFSLRILQDTFGLGVGLGSSRPSSFAAMLLSNVGVVGTGLFIILVATVMRAAWRRHETFEPALWSLVAILCAKVAGEPNMSHSVMWMTIAACAAAVPQVKQAVEGSHPHLEADSDPLYPRIAYDGNNRRR